MLRVIALITVGLTLAATAGTAGAAQGARSSEPRDSRDAAGPAPVVEIREVSSGNFDWGDAAIGSALTLALIGMAAGVALLLGHRRSGRRPPQHELTAE